MFDLPNDLRVSELNNFYYALSHGIFKLKKAKQCDLKKQSNRCLDCNAKRVCQQFNFLIHDIEIMLNDREGLTYNEK